MGPLAITAIGSGWIEVNASKFENALILTSSGLVETLDIDNLNHLSTNHFQRLADLSVDIVLLGSGNIQQFISPELLVPLMAKGIGFESMDTAAAARTFNVLNQENRNVGALIFLAI